MKVNAGINLDSGLIHSVVVAVANVHHLTPAAEQLLGNEDVVFGDADYQGIEKGPEIASKAAEFRVAVRPRKRRTLPDSPEGRLQDLIETAKVHVRAKIEHPFRGIFAKPAGGCSNSSAFKQPGRAAWPRTATK